MKNASQLSKIFLPIALCVLLIVALPFEAQAFDTDQNELEDYEPAPMLDIVDVPLIPEPMLPVDDIGIRKRYEPEELMAQAEGMMSACSADRANLDTNLSVKTSAQESAAAQIAVLMVALAGPPSDGRGGDICDDIKRVALFTPDEVQEAVAGAISASHDPAAAARALLLASAALPANMQEAIGYGLALATHSLSASKYTTVANTIIKDVSSAKSEALQVAYFGDKKETGGIKKAEMTGIRLNSMTMDKVPEHHASES